jgi:hypothetical protein
MERVDSEAAAQPVGDLTRAGELLGDTKHLDPWAAYTDEYRGVAEYRVLAEVLTPQAAALLIAAAQQLASIGYEEVISHGDEPAGT